MEFDGFNYINFVAVYRTNKSFEHKPFLISEVIPTMTSLSKILMTTDSSYNGVGTLKAELLKSLNKRFEDIEINELFATTT